jgi:predicted transcriptional regulator
MSVRPSGDEVRAWRRRNGFTVREISEWLLVCRRSVDSWEAGTYLIPQWVWELMVAYERGVT